MEHGILMSIKPEYVEKMISGEKQYEYRKNIKIEKYPLNRIIVYSTSPKKKIVGEIQIEYTCFGSLWDLWENTGKHGGITKEDFYKYYKGKEKGCAIKIKKFTKYDKEYDLKEMFPNMKRPPQSYCYVEL